MNYELRIKKRKFWIVILFIFLIDRISKFLVLKYFPEIVVFNQNGLFGILPWWVSILGIFGVVFFVWKEKYFNWTIFAILVAGISNLIDRIWYNGVVDFIAIGNFPVFNLADAIISYGVIYLGWMEIRKK